MEQQQQQNDSWIRGKCIGRGSFGTVNLAFNRSNGDVFAVKSVDRSGSLPHQIESLENEITILRSLSSPFVVTYLGDDETRDSPNSTPRRNLHMEYMPGGTVADLAARGDDVDERILRFYTWCVVSALRYVHSRGIVHCDVKGKNILVDHDRGCVKLADFGSAVKLSSSPAPPRGSPLWMAPEVIRGESQGPESDVWSLGCTIVEMITGKPAWEDCGVDTLSRIGFSNESPAFPTRLSKIGRDFLHKCLIRDPAQRWSCDQLLQHPFLLSASLENVLFSSPRCPLDWVNSEFDQSDEEEEENLVTISHGISISAQERIGKLAGKGGANWESDGWTMVRNLEEKQEEGTSMEFENETRAKGETAGISGEYSDSNIIGGTKWEYMNFGGSVVVEMEWPCDHSSGCNWCKAGSSWRYGSHCGEVEFAVDMAFYRSCNLLLVLFYYYCYHCFCTRFTFEFNAFCLYYLYSLIFQFNCPQISHVTNHFLHLNLRLQHHSS